MTDGNFRCLHRLFVQIERILRFNELTVITEDVVEAARSTLVMGDLALTELCCSLKRSTWLCLYSRRDGIII